MSFQNLFGHYNGKDTKEKLVSYIKQNYQGILGNDVNLLDDEDGLDKIRAKYFNKR